jgi:cytochrome P450
LPFAVHEAHEKYGGIIRIAPDELAYIDSRAWKDIYGPRPGKQEIPKDPNFYLNTAVGELSIIGAKAERHGKLRRLLSHGFSERALQDQVPIVQKYIDLFIARLRVLSRKSEPVDMVQWYNVRTPSFL